MKETRKVEFWVDQNLKADDKQFEELVDFFGHIETIEDIFDVEISCGDGLFFSDIMKIEDKEEKDRLWDIYDSKVDHRLIRQHLKDGKSRLLKGKTLVFSVTYDDSEVGPRIWDKTLYKKVKLHIMNRGI